MDADSTIEACGLEEPQIFALVLGWAHREQRTHAFIVLLLYGLQLTVELTGQQIDVPLKYGENMDYLVEPGLKVLVLEVDGECQRNDVVHIDTLPLTVGFHVNEELVFGGQGLVPLNVIDKLLVAELSEALKVYAV